MNPNRYVFLLFLMGILFSYNAYSQCGDIRLNNQQEINDFIKNYGTCSEVDNLTIRDRDNDIVNFDSLYHITRVNDHLDLRNITNSKEKNISGLKNLRYVNQLSYGLLNVRGFFSALDTIDQLSLASNEGSFAQFRHLKHIERYLSINLTTTTCSTEEMPSFTTGEDFDITFSKLVGTSYSTAYRDCVAAVASKFDFSKNISLTLFPVDSFNLDWFPLPDELRNLSFAYHQNSDLSSISKITALKSLNIKNDLGGNNYGAGLSHIEEMDAISLGNINIEGIDYNALLPNLKRVNYGFTLSWDNFVDNLDFLEGVKAPEPTDPKTWAYLVQIRDNPKLRNCNVSFLCEVLKKYPDEVVISNNAGLCTKAEVLKYCATVSTSDTDEKEITLSPNPVMDYIRIKGMDKVMQYEIYNACGINMMSGMTDSDIQVDHLSDGMYFIQLRSESGAIISRKFVKM
ncbi:MAG: T9SS type A sorting domain-containing protein [Chitinophagales bacterium]|nr:T9SS type A sorting domain-containing protein [Chitinophagales bacterium]